MADSANIQWQYEPGRALALRRGDRELWQYHFATDRRKPYFHPLRTASGLTITAFEPWDHVWHRGLWFAWKYINGVNYWEEHTEIARDGRTVIRGPEETRLSADGARVVTQLDYCPPLGEDHGAPVVTETREIHCGVPYADGSYWIDWTQRFTAQGEDAVFDRTVITPQEWWGGYAGLGWRAGRELGNFRSLNSEGHTQRDAHEKQARWLDLSGEADGGRNLAAGLALFDHPSNPRHPSRWYCHLEPGFGYINAGFVMHEPFRLPARETLTLRYRVLVHDGWTEAARMEQEYQSYLKTEAKRG